MCFRGDFTIRYKRGYFYFYQLVSSPCGYKNSSTAFLFSLVNNPGCGPKTFGPPGTGRGARNSYKYAIYSCPGYGPTFGGGHDIHIASEASSNTNSHSYLGYTYNPPAGFNYGSPFATSFLAGSYNFQPVEVEVFYETNYK